jgi:hypothetical protein
MKRLIFATLLAGALFMLQSLPSLLAQGQPATSGGQSQPTASGHWEGSIDVEGNMLEVMVDLTRAADGSWKGVIAIPAQSLKDYPLSNLKVEGSAISFEMASVEGSPTFKGKLSADGKTVTGNLSQSGMIFPFKLERKGEAQSGAASAVSVKVSADLEGNWQGALDAGGVTLRLILKIAKAADGAFTAHLDSPDQGQSNLPINSLTAAGDSLSFEMKYIGASYQGKLNKERTEITGTWEQGGASTPLTLRREAKK